DGGPDVPIDPAPLEAALRAFLGAADEEDGPTCWVSADGAYWHAAVRWDGGLGWDPVGSPTPEALGRDLAAFGAGGGGGAAPRPPGPRPRPAGARPAPRAAARPSSGRPAGPASLLGAEAQLPAGLGVPAAGEVSLDPEGVRLGLRAVVEEH